MTKMATDKQVALCRTLFRKVKVYYRCCKTDEDLRNEVLKRTGFDLGELEAEEAQEIINKLQPQIDRQRGGQWRRR
jgi:hypothetical protein